MGELGAGNTNRKLRVPTHTCNQLFEDTRSFQLTPDLDQGQELPLIKVIRAPRQVCPGDFVITLPHWGRHTVKKFIC